MSREIRFRGKDDDGKWIYGDLLQENEDEVFITERLCILGDYIQSFAVCVDPDSIGQYTGLKDKNGVEIYEGDVIELKNEDYKTIRVVCEFGTVQREVMCGVPLWVDITGFYFRIPNGKATFPIINNYLGKHDLEIFEVIGNIHDTELQEGK